jgi:hypothetical protein
MLCHTGNGLQRFVLQTISLFRYLGFRHYCLTITAEIIETKFGPSITTIGFESNSEDCIMYLEVSFVYS